jgi:hypothetical protein
MTVEERAKRPPSVGNFSGDDLRPTFQPTSRLSIAHGEQPPKAPPVEP